MFSYIIYRTTIFIEIFAYSISQLFNLIHIISEHIVHFNFYYPQMSGVFGFLFDIYI